MSGYNSFRSFEDFCENYEDDLSNALGNPKHGLPSHSCIRRVVIDLDFNVLSQKFYQWIRGKVEIKNKEWMQIDGKGIRGTMTDYGNKYQNFLNLVSLFMNRTGIVLTVKQMDNKEQSEINIVRQLIEGLTLKKIVLSMDAIHCQKKTVEEIIRSQNDYLIKIKRNQKNLFDEAEQINMKNKHQDRHVTIETNRGRKEIREIKTYKPSQNIINNWAGIKTIVYVKRRREIKETKSTTHSYYISSLHENAEKFAEGVRYHWGIENRLHYVKDVTLKEDDSKINTGNAPGILSLVRNLVVNVARINGENQIRKFTRKCAGDIGFMTTLLE